MTATVSGQASVTGASTASLKLGDALIRRGIVSKEIIEKALTIQNKRKKEGELFLLGEILLEINAIESSVLYQFIKTMPPMVSEGQEFGYIMRAIRASIGVEESKNINTIQANNKTQHMFEIISKNVECLPYKVQKRFIVSLMKPFVPNAVVGLPEKISSMKDGAGKFHYSYEGKPVHLGFFPQLGISLLQVIVSKQEYDILTKQPDESSDEHESKGTFGGELPFSVHDIVSDACSLGASDLHIIPKQTDYHVYFRIQGTLVPQSKYMLDLERGRNLIYAFKNIAATYTFGAFLADDKREIKDGRIELAETGGGVDLRVVLLPTGSMADEELVARIIRKTKLEKKPLTDIGYFEEDAVAMEKGFRRRGGLFLVSGKTNSGKTTLCNQLLVRDTDRKWETIEDPIEYTQPNPNICQHQTYAPKEGPQLGFADLVKGFKRGDPDGIFVGEIRNDPVLVNAVVEAAHAGQLVMSTVHIGSCFEIYRAFGEVFGVDFYTAALMILYSHNQTLVKCLCDNCRVVDKDKENYTALNNIKDELPYIVKDDLEDFLNNQPKTFVHNPKGCEQCGGTGYKGQTPIYEYIYPDVKFMKWLLEKEPDRYSIEERACSSTNTVGVNKLKIFIKKLTAGIIDASPQTIQEIM